MNNNPEREKKKSEINEGKLEKKYNIIIIFIYLLIKKIKILSKSLVTNGSKNDFAP